MRHLKITCLAATLVLGLAAFTGQFQCAGTVNVIDAALPIDADCPARAPGAVGGACASDSDCDTSTGAADGICLTDTIVGYCITKYEACTVDAECGTSNVCVVIDDPAGAFHACLPACGTGACVCPNNQLCGDSYVGSPMDKSACLPGNASAANGDPCTGYSDCNVNSICRTDPVEYPGGQCFQVGCTIGSDSTCTAGGHCADPGFVSVGAACVDACTTDGDCRTAADYRCFDSGGAAGKFCRHPQVGDACAVDADCGAAATWDCRTGAGYPGGYCTLQAACNPVDGTGCPNGSSLCESTGYCVDRCTGSGQGTCRASYTCTSMTQPGGGTAGGCL